ncbi:MAG: cyclase family protein [Patescibacteria group bacterium]
MKFIDLSVVVNENTPAYPGDPKIKIETTGAFEKDTYNDHSVMFDVHSSGTHIDAPWHMVADGRTLDQIPIEQFIGRGRLIKVQHKTFDFEAVKGADIQEGDIVLFQTGMSDIYGRDEYYSDRPAMPEEVANYLVEKKIKMIGVDMCSPDLEPFPVHRILLGAGILIIENLTNLDKLNGKEFTVYALPIKLQLDGAPARVIAEIKQ